MSRHRRLAPLVAAALVVAACSAGRSEVVRGAETTRSGDPVIEQVTFSDVASDVGLDFRHGAFRWTTGGDPAAMMGGGLCWIDYDADGWLDLFVVNTWSDGEYHRWADESGPPTSRLFANESGTFTDVSDSVGAGLEIRGNGCVAADLDGDGWTDLFVTTDRANVLLWNEQGQSFTEGAAAAGLATFGWHAGAAAGDVNGDGLLDLFVAGYADTNRRIPEATRGFPNTFQPEADLLFLNQGAADGERPRFVDVAAEVGVEVAGLEYGLGAILSDIDADGDLDVFVANDTNPNRLYLNVRSGPLGFALVERGASAGVDDDNAGMGIASGDYDGSGFPDLAVTNMGEQLHNVFRDDGAAPSYLDALPSMGLVDLGAGLTGWGTAWADVDLDTDLDLVIVHGSIPVRDLVDDRQPVKVFENRGANGEPGAFRDASTTVGLDDAYRYLGRGLAVADYDNDGDLDLAVGTIGGELALLRNSAGGGHWLTVAPEPPLPGTVVTVTSPDGGERTRELLAGSSYLSSEDQRLHFGLGRDDEIQRVRVDWPDGRSVVLDDPDVDRIHSVRPE